MSLSASQLTTTRSRLLGRARRVAEFALGQLATQALQAATGLLLLRWLAVEAYAQYSAATAIESTVRILVDLGASSAIVAFVAPNAANRRRAGQYVRAVLTFRLRMFIAVIAPTAIAFIVIFRAQHWQVVLGVPLFLATLTSVWFNGMISVRTPLLSVHQRLRAYYNVSAAIGVGRIVVLACLKGAYSLNALLAMLVNVAAAWLQSHLLHTRTRALADVATHTDSETLRELHDYLKPVIPLTLYFAIQGQLTIFLVSLLGRAQEIAAVGALGRLAQLFTFLSAANSMLVAPAIAAAAESQLVRRYSLVVVTAAGIGATLVLVATFWPEPLLWLLGPRYKHLRLEVAWMVVASSIAYLGSVIYTMNVARKWVFTWVTYGGLAVQVVAQVGSAVMLDLSQAINAVYMTTIASVTALLPQLVASGLGLKRVRASR